MIKIRDNDNYEKLTLPFVTKDNQGIIRMYIEDIDAKIRYISLISGCVNCADEYSSIKEAVESFPRTGEFVVNAEIVIFQKLILT